MSQTQDIPHILQNKYSSTRVYDTKLYRFWQQSDAWVCLMCLQFIATNKTWFVRWDQTSNYCHKSTFIIQLCFQEKKTTGRSWFSAINICFWLFLYLRSTNTNDKSKHWLPHASGPKMRKWAIALFFGTTAWSTRAVLRPSDPNQNILGWERASRSSGNYSELTSRQLPDPLVPWTEQITRHITTWTAN